MEQSKREQSDIVVINIGGFSLNGNGAPNAMETAINEGLKAKAVYSFSPTATSAAAKEGQWAAMKSTRDFIEAKLENCHPNDRVLGFGISQGGFSLLQAATQSRALFDRFFAIIAADAPLHPEEDVQPPAAGLGRLLARYGRFYAERPVFADALVDRLLDPNLGLDTSRLITIETPGDGVVPPQAMHLPISHKRVLLSDERLPGELEQVASRRQYVHLVLPPSMRTPAPNVGLSLEPNQRAHMFWNDAKKAFPSELIKALAEKR